MSTTQQEKFKCIICGNSSFTIPFNSRSFKVVECETCKFGIVDPIPDDEQLSALYNSSEYFATHMQYDYDKITDQKIKSLIEQSGKTHERYLRKYLLPGCKILEIGPGGGFALKYFKDKGYNVKGIETSESSVKFAREKLGLDIDQNNFENFADDQCYDIIMLNHVLEHFKDPNDAMRLLEIKLKKGGILYVRVPNHDSYDRRKFKEKWPAYLPFHISYFSRKSLETLFNHFNLYVLEISEFISEKFLETAPGFIKAPVKKLIHYSGLTSFYNGRTITIIGKLK